MFNLPSRNPTSSRKRLSGFGSASRLTLQTPNPAPRKQTADRETRGVAATRRPRTGLTTQSSTGGSAPAIGGAPRLFALRNSSGSSQGHRYGTKSVRTGDNPSLETTGVFFSSRNNRGTTSDTSNQLGTLVKRAQLWKPSTGKPGTSSASCRSTVQREAQLGPCRGSAQRDTQLGFTLPSSLNRSGANSALGSLTRTESRTETVSRPEVASAVKLLSGACCLPHPAKNGMGEDAHFVLDNAVGVADGVGGWAAHGIDAGMYARELMGNAKAAVVGGTVDPVEAMWRGYETVDTLGSSTCLVMILDPQSSILQSANLGDSSYRHVRGSVVVSRGKVGQHYFNCPYQLGSHSADDPNDSLRQSIQTAIGDKLVAGSDGLFDNLFDQEIVSALESHPKDCNAAALAICKLAQEAAINVHRQGPFAKEANASGIQFQGGKLDDITCVVATVVAAE